MGNPTAPFGAIIDHHGLNLAPGEYDNGRPAVVLEYGIDLNQGCPEYKTYLIQTFGKAVFRGAVLSASTQPWNQVWHNIVVKQLWLFVINPKHLPPSLSTCSDSWESRKMAETFTWGKHT